MVVEFHDPYVGAVRIAEQHVPDLYQMACDYSRQRGNTFAYLQIELERQYPKLKERYGTASED